MCVSPAISALLGVGILKTVVCEFSCVSAFFAPCSSLQLSSTVTEDPTYKSNFICVFPFVLTVFCFLVSCVSPWIPSPRSASSTTLCWTHCSGSGPTTTAPSTSHTPPDWAGGKLSSGVWRASIPDPEHSQTQSPAHHHPAMWSSSPSLPWPTSHRRMERQCWGSSRSRSCW